MKRIHKLVVYLAGLVILVSAVWIGFFSEAGQYTRSEVDEVLLNGLGNEWRVESVQTVSAHPRRHGLRSFLHDFGIWKSRGGLGSAGCDYYAVSNTQEIVLVYVSFEEDAEVEEVEIVGKELAKRLKEQLVQKLPGLKRRVHIKP